VRREAVMLSAGKTARLDFTLPSRQPSITDATASEIVAVLPGSNDQKHLLVQCDNCHSLQCALRTPRTKEEWTQIIRRMAGERAVSRDTPGTRAFGQKKYVEPLAEYLASIRGPGSSDQIAFDPDGNVVFGMGGGTVRFNPRTEEFTPWASGSNMFGMDPAGKVWYLDKGLHKLDLKSGEVKHYMVPDGTDDDTYDMETDAQ